jgi:hypothetical protein
MVKQIEVIINSSGAWVYFHAIEADTFTHLALSTGTAYGFCRRRLEEACTEHVGSGFVSVRWICEESRGKLASSEFILLLVYRVTPGPDYEPSDSLAFKHTREENDCPPYI